MGLTCSCRDDYDWFYYSPDDFTVMPSMKRRKRCVSCKDFIPFSADALKFECYRQPNSEIEENIYGECGEVPMADKWMCERCGGLFLSLNELGYCINIEESMLDLVKEYAAMQAEDRLNRRAA